MAEALISVDDARASILRVCASLPAERVAVVDAAGRVLARDVVSRRAIPAFENSAMDGFGVRSVDVAAAGETRLRLVGTQLAGATAARGIEGGEAVGVMTGARIPTGVDAVIMREHVRIDGDAVVVIGPVPAGQHVRRRGEDMDDGVIAARAGTRITPAVMNLLLSCGHMLVDVVRRPVVAIVASGDELREIGEPLEDDSVVNSNAWAIAAAVRHAGGDARVLGIAHDTLDDHVRLMQAATGADVLLTIGGVSVGDADFVRPALESIGTSLTLWRVAMRPGKPLAFGMRGAQLVFGLPGNPVSSLVTFELFVRPALARLQGLDDDVRALRATLVDDKAFRKKRGLALFARAFVHELDGALHVRTLERQGSGQISGLAAANALVCFGVDDEEIQPGAAVRILRLT